MSTQTAIELLLRAGYSDKAIERQLNVSRRRARDLRQQLGLPNRKPGPTAAATVEDLFWRRAQPTRDGHLMWPGYDPQHGAGIRHNGRRQSAYRVAFRIRYGREPVGRVEPGCGQAGCVHPRHVEDRPMRQQYRAIFGEVA
ncbi:hypothetical protein [Streptomyces ziwulingensis]|uniref:Uncharacterized protein n=1 Tax=Streptomyces ziwulingensis TaxID=1045501 RepID=A0ABP9CZZ0_9ACTN